MSHRKWKDWQNGQHWSVWPILPIFLFPVRHPNQPHSTLYLFAASNSPTDRPESALCLLDDRAPPLVVALGAVRVAVAQPLLPDAVPAAQTAVRAPIHAGTVFLVGAVAAVGKPIADPPCGDAPLSADGGRPGGIHSSVNS